MKLKKTLIALSLLSLIAIPLLTGCSDEGGPKYSIMYSTVTQTESSFKATATTTVTKTTTVPGETINQKQTVTMPYNQGASCCH